MFAIQSGECVLHELRGILQTMNNGIRDYTMHLMLVWAVALLPVAIGLILLLALLSPDRAAISLLELILATATSISLHLYLVW